MNPILRAWLHIRCAVLRWNIGSTDNYLAACERDGIMDSLTLRFWRDHQAAERVELALLQARLRGSDPDLIDWS